MAKEKLKKVSLTKEVKAAIIVSFLAIFLFGGIMLLSTKENDGLSEEELNKTINGIEKPEEPEKPQIIEMSNEYMEALEEYKESLRIYREELLELYELQAKLEKGEIKFSEYINNTRISSTTNIKKICNDK